jgi:hypothetical protein
LIAFFTLHPVGRDEHAEEMGALIKEWISALPPAASADEGPDETERAWRAGKL